MAFRREMIGVALSAALLLVLLPATALAAPQWVGGEVLDAAGGVPDVATDAQGNSAAVWTRAGHVWVAERPHGGPWGAAEDLEPAGGAEAQPPKIVALPDGELVAAWVGGDFGFEVHAARRPAGGGWSASAVINSTCCPNLEDLVVGADGTVMGYWTSDDGPSETAVKPPGSADWDPAQTLAQGGPDTEVALAPDGSAVAAYPDCAVTCISAVHRPPGGDWGDPEAVSAAVGAVTGIALASRPDNRFTVVWTEGPAPIGVRSADRSPGAAGTWGARQPVADTPAGRAGCPSGFGCVDLASRGDTLAAVWQQGSEIAAALRSGGGGWGAAEHVGDPDEGDATPQAALTADGTAVGPGESGSRQ
jgi:hypothetical protein